MRNFLSITARSNDRTARGGSQVPPGVPMMPPMGGHHGRVDISMATTQALYRQQLALIRQQLAGMRYQAEEACRLGVGYR